jgi:lysozyme
VLSSAAYANSSWNQVLDGPQQRKFELLTGAESPPAPSVVPDPPMPTGAKAPGQGVNRVPSMSHVSVESRRVPVRAAPSFRPKAQALPLTPARRGPPGKAGQRAVQLAPMIDEVALRYDIDPLLLHAIARVESAHNASAISHAGAHGLMQVIVPTAQRFGVAQSRQLHDPRTNLEVSARYLKRLQSRFSGRLDLVLAAYNAGEGAVEKHGRRIPPYKETQGYVRKVLAEYANLRRIRGQQLAGLTRAEAGL